MPFDLDVADRDYRQDLSPDQLERLERRQAPARRAALPPTSLAAAVDRLASNVDDDATTHDVGDVPSPALGTASTRPSRLVGFDRGQVPSR